MTEKRIRFGDNRLPAAFWDRVQKMSNGCWVWSGRVDSVTGYGQAWDRKRGMGLPAHRVAYNFLVQQLPGRGEAGYLQVDHECHNRNKTCKGGPACVHRRCVNPAHLVAREPGDNTKSSRHTPASKNAAKTHCDRGHPLSGDNLMVDVHGRRNCRTCKIAVGSETRRRRLAAQRPAGWRKVEWNSAKTHCKNEHPFDEENTRWVRSSNGNWTRQCRTCTAEASRRHYERNHGKRAG